MGESSTDKAPYYAHVIGWGMAVPEGIMTNDDLAAFVDTSSEWIVARTGIRERRIASDRESTFTLGRDAALAALKIAEIHAGELDLIICATSTAENVFPATANLIQSDLGAGNAGAFDLSAACSGFVYGVYMASQAIRSGAAKTALVIGSETMSRVMDWQDRSTCILFGDGAGAVVLERRTEPGGVLSGVLRSEGQNAKNLYIPAFGSIDLDINHEALRGERLGKMVMDGQEVFKFATRVIADGIKQAVARAGITMADVKLIVPHQANLRIIDAAARALGIDKDMFVVNLERYGNTSAASIPLALAETVQEGRIKEGDYIVLVGFGGGLTWAASVIQWTGPGRQKREFGLAEQVRLLRASAGSTLRRIARRYGRIFNELSPERGRMQRLKSRMDREEHEK